MIEIELELMLVNKYNRWYMKGRLFTFFLVSLLTACGGGGGSVDKTGTNSSSSRAMSSSSASSTVVATCTNTEGAVFIDEVCGAWQLSFYEQNKNTFAGGENTTGEGNNLTLTIVTETAKPNNKVIDIQYGANNDYNALARLLVNSSYPNGIDLSEYTNGSIQYDLKVINTGDDNSPLQMTIECGWPCASTFDIIEPAALNEWKKVEIPVARLIDRGLDIQKVMTGWQLGPEWNKQNGYHMQIDNIRWVKNNVQAPTANICYANYLGELQTDSTYIDISLLGSDGPSMEHLNISSAYPTLIFSPKWHLTNSYSLAVGTSIDRTTFEPTNPDVISNCIDNGILNFEIFIDKGYTDDYPLSISIGFAGRNQIPISFASMISNADLTPGGWTKFSMPVSITQSGLHQVVFNIIGPGTEENLGAIMIDNIVIIKPAF